ncbi:MAG TPA: hypothetical protein VK875_12975 [Euzebyales bacterium]|nr:hypothetical protein [Euzebyales bacterium]
MGSKDRQGLREATLALVLGVLVVLVPPGRARAGDSEAPTQDAEPAAPPATLVLEAVCGSGDMHRFAVVHTSGPATRFTPASGDAVAIAAGTTVHFWVDDPDTAVTITWPGGSAEASPSGEPCAAEPEPADPEPADPEPAPDPPAGDPDPEPAPIRPPGETATAAVPVDPPAAAGPPAGPVADPDPPGDERVAPPGDSLQGAPAAVAPAPRPRPGPDGFVCPDGWVIVDADGDRSRDASDACERLVETGVPGRPAGTWLTTAALIVTLGLLLASLAAGMTGRVGGRRPAP